MSHENVEVVQEVISAVNDRDLDRLVAHCTESIQLETPWAAVEGAYEGSDAMRRFFSDLHDTLPEQDFPTVAFGSPRVPGDSLRFGPDIDLSGPNGRRSGRPVNLSSGPL